MHKVFFTVTRQCMTILRLWSGSRCEEAIQYVIVNYGAFARGWKQHETSRRPNRSQVKVRGSASET